MKIRLFYILFLTATLLSCNSNNKKHSLKEKNKLSGNKLALKYNAVTNWDSAYQYTVNYQEEFIEEKKLLLFDGRIYDIIKEDSNYLVKVLDERENSPRNFLAILTMTNQQYDKVFDTTTSDRGGFIIQISKIKVSNPSVKMDEASDGDDGSYTYTHLSDDKDQMLLIFYGKVIDFYLDEINEK